MSYQQADVVNMLFTSRQVLPLLGHRRKEKGTSLPADSLAPELASAPKTLLQTSQRPALAPLASASAVCAAR